MLRETDTYYENKEEPYRSCLLALRSIILAQDSHISETQKYGMPCFCYRGKAFCYLWTDKKTQEPYILMVEGQHLSHPMLEEGTRKRMKILRVNPREDLAIATIEDILQSAIARYKNATIKINK